jgi:hypothetical protein
LFLSFLFFFWLCASVLPLGCCVVAETRCNWYLLILIYTLYRKNILLEANTPRPQRSLLFSIKKQYLQHLISYYRWTWCFRLHIPSATTQCPSGNTDEHKKRRITKREVPLRWSISCKSGPNTAKTESRIHFLQKQRLHEENITQVFRPHDHISYLFTLEEVYTIKTMGFNKIIARHNQLSSDLGFHLETFWLWTSHML